MKWQKRRNRAAESVDPEFAEALLGNSPERSSIDRKVQRKTQQFCRQVQRALNLALASGDSQSQGYEIFVEEVSPAPDCGHLLAHIMVLEGQLLSEAMAWLPESIAASHRNRDEHLLQASARVDLCAGGHNRR